MALAIRKQPVADPAYLKLNIEDVGFSIRIINALNKRGVTTLGDLSNHRRDDILILRGIGATAIDTIDETMQKYGICFKH